MGKKAPRTVPTQAPSAPAAPRKFPLWILPVVVLAGLRRDLGFALVGIRHLRVDLLEPHLLRVLQGLDGTMGRQRISALVAAEAGQMRMIHDNGVARHTETGGREVDVAGKAENADGKPLARVLLYFHPQDGTGTNAAQCPTQSDGTFSMRAFPGAYKVTVQAIPRQIGGGPGPGILPPDSGYDRFRLTESEL